MRYGEVFYEPQEREMFRNISCEMSVISYTDRKCARVVEH